LTASLAIPARFQLASDFVLLVALALKMAGRARKRPPTDAP
jgi:hypothetical protein